jgi:hypothetical protein
VSRAASPTRRPGVALALVGLLGGGIACNPERHLLGLLVDAGGPRVDAADMVAHDAAPEPPADGPSPDASEGDANETGSPLTVPELWGEFVVLTCEKMQTCCTDDEKLHNSLASSREFCESMLTNVRKGLATIQAERIVRSIDEGRAAYRPENIDACLARLGGLSCGDARASRELACEEVIQALVPIDGTCATSSHYECIDGYCAAGTCAGRKADGAACYEDPECSSRYCTGKGGGGTCTSPIGRLDDLCAP